jgi:hypothetical protein
LPELIGELPSGARPILVIDVVVGTDDEYLDPIGADGHSFRPPQGSTTERGRVRERWSPRRSIPGLIVDVAIRLPKEDVEAIAGARNDGQHVFAGITRPIADDRVVSGLPERISHVTEVFFWVPSAIAIEVEEERSVAEDTDLLAAIPIPIADNGDIAGSSKIVVNDIVRVPG